MTLTSLFRIRYLAKRGSSALYLSAVRTAAAAATTANMRQRRRVFDQLRIASMMRRSNAWYMTTSFLSEVSANCLIYSDTVSCFSVRRSREAVCLISTV